MCEGLRTHDTVLVACVDMHAVAACCDRIWWMGKVWITCSDGVSCGVDAQDWDDGSVTLAQLNRQEASDRTRMQSLGGIVRGGQLTQDTAANPEVPPFLC